MYKQEKARNIIFSRLKKNRNMTISRLQTPHERKCSDTQAWQTQRDCADLLRMSGRVPRQKFRFPPRAVHQPHPEGLEALILGGPCSLLPFLRQMIKAAI